MQPGIHYSDLVSSLWLAETVPTASKAEAVLISGLLSYGITEVLNGTTLAPLTNNGADHNDDDVIIISNAQELNNLALRRLTLSSKRLPSHMVVWGDMSQSRFVAARVAWNRIRELLFQHPGGSLEDALRLLQRSDPSIACYPVQHFVSTDALRLGGSWAKCAIRKYFTKTASGSRGKPKLLDEINFYRTLPSSLALHYLEILYSREDNHAITMGLEYRDDPNLRDLLMHFQITPQEAAELLRRILTFEYHEAYEKHRRPTPENYLQEFHYQRVWIRLAMCLEIDPELAGLIQARQLIINGERLPNIPAMLYQLEQSSVATARLTPNGVSPHIHGDIHLENILYDAPNDHFYLVDPRGYPACDIFYDLGKLQHSYHGGYDLLHEGRHQVEWEFSPDGDSTCIDYTFTAPLIWARYQELTALMRDVVQDVLGGCGEHDIELKALFNEAMHFPSITPFHIHHGPTPNLTVPFYAVGAQLLAQVLRALNIELETCFDVRDDALQRLALIGGQPWKFGD